MATSGLLLLALVLRPVLGDWNSSTLQEGRCLTWGNNVVTNVFHDCCSGVALETVPRLALTAFCPNGMVAPDSNYTFSRLYLDECLYLSHSGRSLVTMGEDVALQARGLSNISSECSIEEFTFAEDPPRILGRCGGNSSAHEVRYNLEFLILSYRGVLTCGGSARGVVSGAFNRTCRNITITRGGLGDEPILTAMCDVNPFRQSGEADLYVEPSWRESKVSLRECFARNEDIRGSDLARCPDVRLVDSGGAVLSAECGIVKTSFSLADFIRNDYGTLACYGYRGT